MVEITLDGLLATLSQDVPAEEKPEAVAVMRLIAAGLRSPATVADALDRAAARLEGSAGV